MWNLNNVIMKLNSEQYLKRDIKLFLELPLWLTSMYVSPDEISRVKHLLKSKTFLVKYQSLLQFSSNILSVDATN